MIGISIGVVLFLISLIINLVIPQKKIEDYPSDIIEEIHWNNGMTGDAAPTSIPNYYGRVKYKMQNTEFYYTESTPSASPQFNKKISFKRPLNLKHKNLYIFNWSIKALGIMVFIIALVLKLIK